MRYSYPQSIIQTHFFDFTLDKTSRVSIAVRDMMGKIVSRVVDSVLNPGEHEVFWHAVDNNGDPLPTGVYYYTLETDEFIATKSMIIVN